MALPPDARLEIPARRRRVLQALPGCEHPHAAAADLSAFSAVTRNSGIVASFCIALCKCDKHCTDDICSALQKEVTEANSFVFDWQNLAPGVALLLAEATNWQPPSFTVRVKHLLECSMPSRHQAAADQTCG